MSTPGTIRRPVSLGITYRCARGMEPIGARIVIAIWHRCAPMPGRTAEAWRQKRTRSCRLTRRASPSVRTWNVTAKSYGREIERKRLEGILLFGRSNLKRLSDRSSRSIRTALPHTHVPKRPPGACQANRAGIRRSATKNIFQPRRGSFKLVFSLGVWLSKQARMFSRCSQFVNVHRSIPN